MIIKYLLGLFIIIFVEKNKYYLLIILKILGMCRVVWGEGIVWYMDRGVNLGMDCFIYF